MIAIIDYGVGNLFSLQSCLKAIGEKAIVTSDEKLIHEADRIILPGGGAFEDAANKLRESGMAEVIKTEVDQGKPLLGICLGMQLLLESSEEYGFHKGLGLIRGVNRFIGDYIPSDYKIPHMGWNSLIFTDKKHPLFRYTKEKEYVYFVHSYAGYECEENTIATTEYGAMLTAAIANRNVMGTQFHPEKSGESGLKIMKAFCELKKEDLC